MLELCFVRPRSINRIRSSWVGPLIERYLTSLQEHGYAVRHLAQRVPILMQFGNFAQVHGAQSYRELPAYLEQFVTAWVNRPDREPKAARPRRAREVQGALERMLRISLPGFVGTSPCLSREPFADRAPGFLTYLREERGLQETTLGLYGNHLRQFDAYLKHIGVQDVHALSPAVVSGFLTDRSAGLKPSTIHARCAVLRVFLRYLHREQFTACDLSAIVEGPPDYRLASIPRAITSQEMQLVLNVIDRETVLGRRDYAMLLLLVTYGLRAREVAALTFEDLDWRQNRLRIPQRKADHSTIYPLSPVVGNALIDYLKDRRTSTSFRQVFLRIVAPWIPVTHVAVAHRAAHYLHKANIVVHRAGSHTLRHTCVQRLVDAGWSLKKIGDYVGHRSPSSTEIYGKVAVDVLRELACGDGEEIL
jgi:integrase/recombinase XerD